MPSENEMRATLTRYLDCVGKRDVAGVLALFAEGISVEDPVGGAAGTHVVGRDNVAAFFAKGFSKSQPSPQLAGPIITTLADEAAMALTLRLELGGRPCEVDVIDIAHFDEAGKIDRLRAFWNPNEIRPRT